VLSGNAFFEVRCLNAVRDGGEGKLVRSEAVDRMHFVTVLSAVRARCRN